MVTRIGDTAMAIGLFLLATQLGTLDIQELMQRAVLNGPWAPAWLYRCRAAARRGCRQIGATPAANLAARCHGRPHTYQRSYPRGDDGDCRRLPDRPHSCPLFTLAPVQFAVAVIGAATLLLAAFSALTQTGYQARAGLLHHQPDRLHVSGAGRRRLVGGHLSIS